ncbi:MAG: hypothetical protein NC205_05770 [Prevotella sp.]|nr:hypothetical protein [Alistipes senegalensis]MCM1358083.1 hypothetical protein [Prevotella sp.]MCM1473916.1 hypothetical protein [Muribaculaceae bacterium]
MKKLIAVLSVCMMITCSFASCGDEKTEESSEKSVSVSESEAETSETETEEDTTQEETTTEIVTEEETTEATTEKSVEDLTGMWYTEDEDGTFAGFKIKPDGKIDMIVDVTEMSHFTADGGLFMNGDILKSEYIDYDGKNLVIEFNGKEAFNMTKDSGDADSYDGEYTLKSGVMYDSVSDDGNYDVGVIVNGEMMFAGYRDILSYTINDNIVSLNGLKNLDYDFDTAEVEYELSGDKITLFEADDDGSDIILKKLDFATYKPVSVSKASTESAEDDKTEKSTEKKTSEITEDDRTTEGSIVGAWYSGASYGFRFDENGSGGVFVDATEMLHFTADGKFFMSEMTLEPETINFDGTNLSITMQGNDILTMTRNDGNNPDSFDGIYTFKSGAFYEGMAISLGESFGVEPENAVVYAIVDGEKMYVEFTGLFRYTAENGNAVFEGLESMGIPDGSAIEYEFSGDNLIIDNQDGTEEIFTRIDL